MEKEKAYLELAEAQKNLNLADIKKNIVRCTISLLDNNSYDRQDILVKDIESKKYNPVQTQDRSFCKDKIAKNSYQFY